jgi:hypothetical protein
MHLIDKQALAGCLCSAFATVVAGAVTSTPLAAVFRDIATPEQTATAVLGGIAVLACGFCTGGFLAFTIHK